MKIRPLYSGCCSAGYRELIRQPLTTGQPLLWECWGGWVRVWYGIRSRIICLILGPYSEMRLGSGSVHNNWKAWSWSNDTDTCSSYSHTKWETPFPVRTLELSNLGDHKWTWDVDAVLATVHCTILEAEKRRLQTILLEKKKLSFFFRWSSSILEDGPHQRWRRSEDNVLKKIEHEVNMAQDEVNMHSMR